MSQTDFWFPSYWMYKVVKFKETLTYLCVWNNIFVHEKNSHCFGKNYCWSRCLLQKIFTSKKPSLAVKRSLPHKKQNVCFAEELAHCVIKDSHLSVVCCVVQMQLNSLRRTLLKSYHSKPLKCFSRFWGSAAHDQSAVFSF